MTTYTYKINDEEIDVLPYRDIKFLNAIDAPLHVNGSFINDAKYITDQILKKMDKLNDATKSSKIYEEVLLHVIQLNNTFELKVKSGNDNNTVIVTENK